MDNDDIPNARTDDLRLRYVRIDQEIEELENERARIYDEMGARAEDPAYGFTISDLFRVGVEMVDQ